MIDRVQHPYKAWLPAPLYWPYRGLRTLGVGFCFFAFWTSIVVLGWLWLPVLMVWPGDRATKYRRGQRLLRRGFQAFHLLMRVLRLYHRVSPGAVPRPPGVARTSGAVLIANHPTLCDMTAIVSLFPDVVAVAGAGYSEHFLLRHCVRGVGFIPSGAGLLRDAEERLRMGFDVLIFPEGTRSPFEGGLQPFHRGAFEIALRARVPIVVLELTCVPKALSKRRPIWKHPDTTALLTITATEVIDPTVTGLDSKAMCRAVQERYRVRYPATA